MEVLNMPDEEQKKIFAKNLNRYLSLSNKTQKEVADAIGVIPSTFNTWCQGIALPRMGKVQVLADYFGINKTDLIDEKSPISISSNKGIIIKVLGSVAAGIPISAVEDIIDEEEVTEDMARQGNLFGLRIKGHSMEPNICDGDTVIVKEQPDAENGETVVVLINGDEATCKKIDKYEDGNIRLVPNNPAFSPKLYTLDEISTLPVTIVGKVIELRRKF